jgi:hypothetical protein
MNYGTGAAALDPLGLNLAAVTPSLPCLHHQP